MSIVNDLEVSENQEKENDSEISENQEKENDSEISENQIEVGKNNIKNILEQDMVNFHNYDDHKLGRSLTENAKPFTLWGKRDGIQYRIINGVELEAIPSEYAQCIMDFYKLQEISEFLPSGNFTCEEIDNIEQLTIELIKAIGGENISLEEMTADKISILLYVLTPEEIEKIGGNKIALMSLDELNELIVEGDGIAKVTKKK